MYIKGLIENDHHIIKMIYDENFPSISMTICKNSGNEQEAWDVFQEALIIVYTKVQKGNFQLTSKFNTFLHSVCWRLWLKELRKNKASVVIKEESMEYTNVVDEADLMENANRIIEDQLYRKKFEQLGEACKELLRLYFEKLSMDEISKKMGYTVNFATQKAFRCRKKLISSIKEDTLYKELMS